ncbi:MAG: methyltransferase domain-containing protein, partial [Pseudomonadota bacterium]|nr:methyltransferase domain-containing protein [Pseudomonadota bacterium]
MTSNDGQLHVYRREISAFEQTSLSVVAGLVEPGSVVLDLGTGSGALGRHLRELKGCVLDGVTLNEAEAVLARPHYRRIEVADLDQAPLGTLFQRQAYDCIVCADVLEHLKQPEQVLRACRELLSPTGKVLISVPNVGYCGLIAELLQGEFEYRPEGLLDQTHLRFFTRRSLGRFLEAEGWSLLAVQPVARALNESEFRVPFDNLPPAVSRYLLAVPDALTYQFVAAVAWQPQAAAATALHGQPHQSVGQALFSAELFLGHRGDYAQESKLTVSGVIGQARQTLCFRWGEDVAPWSAIRFDPADRPGFIHLYRLTLKDADGMTLWQWRCGSDDFSRLATASSQQLLLRAPWPDGAPALALLHGDDPWIELPIEPAALVARGDRRAGSVEVELGWPMSADYLALKDVAQPLHDRLTRIEPELTRQSDARARLEHELAAQRATLTASLEHSERQRQAQQDELSASLDQQQVLSDALARSERQLLEQREHLLAQKNALADEKRDLQQAHSSLRTDFDGLFAYVQRIERSKSFRMTRPLSRLKGRIDRLLGFGSRVTAQGPSPAVETPMTPTPWPVDVIVPVYRGLADTQRCVESVLSSRNAGAFRLIVINDAGPEPELTAWLRELQHRDTRVVLVENEENLGFVGTVNRGMSMSDAHDVILLNSDTEVANDWLDRLRRAA